MSLYDVPQQELVECVAVALQKVEQIKPPEWALFAKISSQNEKPPVRPDWWYVRAASVLRRIAILGPVGVSKLSIKFGGKKNRGYAPSRFAPSGRNHIRKILQQLEKAGFCKQDKKASHKGRVITPQGMSFLDSVATVLMKQHDVVFAKKPEQQLSNMMPKEPKKMRAKKKPVQKETAGQTVSTSDDPSAEKKPRRKKKTDVVAPITPTEMPKETA